MLKVEEHVNIDDSPDVLHLVEDVVASGEPRVLRRGTEDVAVIIPIEVAKSRLQGKLSKSDRNAFLASAGGWYDGAEVDAFKVNNAESRRLSTRPVIEL